MKLFDKFPNNKVPTFADRDIIIKDHIKERKEIVYGAKAMNKQLPLWIAGRPTQDYDVLSKKPKQSARRLEVKLDKATGRDQYYTKRASYEYTTKVISRGIKLDDPSDDYGVADFTKQKGKVKTNRINGIKYADLTERESSALSTLDKPEFSFRHQKDKDDLKRIEIARRF